MRILRLPIAFHLGTAVWLKAKLAAVPAVTKCAICWRNVLIVSASVLLFAALSQRRCAILINAWATTHNDEICDNITRMKRAWADERRALATVHRFNAANGNAWFWPKIAAALTSKHHWLVVACDSCGTVVDLDLRVKPRDPEASIRIALRDVRCPRCNGYWRPRIVALASHPSV